MRPKNLILFLLDVMCILWNLCGINFPWLLAPASSQNVEVYGTYKQGGGPQALDLAARSKGQFFF